MGGLLTQAFLGSPLGCVSKPTMHLNHAEISGANLAAYPPALAVVLTVVIDVYNPNSYDIAVRAMRGQVTMAEQFTVPIEFRPSGQGVWLGASTTTSLRVPVTIPIPMGLAVLRTSVAQELIPYRVVGRADVTASRTFQVERDDYSVDERGTVSRGQIAAVIPNSL